MTVFLKQCVCVSVFESGGEKESVCARMRVHVCVPRESPLKSLSPVYQISSISGLAGLAGLAG